MFSLRCHPVRFITALIPHVTCTDRDTDFIQSKVMENLERANQLSHLIDSKSMDRDALANQLVQGFTGQSKYISLTYPGHVTVQER